MIVKKAIAIGLLTIYLFSTTAFSQLLKIPILVTHYLEHKAASNLSIAKFIIIHYADSDIRDADYDKDMKLPFKTHENYAGLVGTFINQSSLLINKPLYFHFKKTKYVFSDNTLIFSYHSSIWQPPKFG